MNRNMCHCVVVGLLAVALAAGSALGKSAESAVARRAYLSTAKILTPSASGSGVFVYQDSRGGVYLLTSEHVLDPYVEVSFYPFGPGDRIPGWYIQPVAVDSLTDLALLYIAPAAHFDPPALCRVRRSSAPVRNRVIISGGSGPRGPSLYEAHTIGVSGDDFVINRSLYPGMSGGPVLDMGGNLIGINRATSRYSDEACCVHDDAIKRFLKTNGYQGLYGGSPPEPPPFAAGRRPSSQQIIIFGNGIVLQIEMEF